MDIKVRFLQALASVALLNALSLRAGGLESTFPVAPEVFVVQSLTQTGPHCLPTRYAQITIDTNRFAFIIPDNLGLDTSTARVLKLLPSDYSRLFYFSLIGQAPSEPLGLSVDALREKVLADYPGCVIQMESGASAANLHGPAFDLQWVASGKIDRFVRVAFVFSKFGIFEFSAVSSLASANQAKTELNAIMLSFQTPDPNGKLSLPARPDAS